MDISGTAYFVDGDALGREVSGLRLVLSDPAGKQIARARTEGDGTYYFEQVPAGQYTIAIDKNQAASLRIHLAEPIKLTVEPTGDYLKQVVKVSRD